MADAEDFEAMEAERQAAEAMTGWNGSTAPYVPGPREFSPPPPEVRQRLQAIRDRCARSAG